MLVNCQSQDKAQDIIDFAIEYSGGNKYNSHILEFDFRKYHLVIDENNGDFSYKRTFTDTLGKHIQKIDSNGLQYEISNRKAELNEKKRLSIEEGINSQVYFALLPYKLNDPAVIKSYQGEETINEKTYHKIKITFQQEGGGIDFEDQFLYWFDSENYSMDYLAYLFHVNGGGLRFREAKNQRKINDIVFQDYINYKPPNKTSLDSLSVLFKANKLTKLSEINLENISVNRNK
jgi:hypothetical protein